MSDSDKTPVWHAIVGEGYEPVQIGDKMKPDEDVLQAGGWVCANHGGGAPYREGWPPRRRRKPCIDVWTIKNGDVHARIKAAKPGDCFMVSKDGDLIPIDKPAEGGA